MKESNTSEQPGLLSRMLNALDARLRWGDLFSNAIYPPFIKESTSTLQRGYSSVLSWFRPRGHAATAGLSLVAFLVFLVFGPGLGHRIEGYFLLVAALVGAWVVIRYSSPRWLMPAVMMLVAVVGLVQWWMAGTFLEREAHLFRHILVPVSWVLIVNILIAYALAAWLFKRFEGRFAEDLQRCELLVLPPIYPIRAVRVIRSFFTAPFYHPLYLLLPPALVVLALPERTVMEWAAVAAFIVSWLLIVAAGVHERLSMLLVLGRKIFFTGGQLIVSLVVIMLAAMRLYEVHYVSFLIESQPEHVNYTILLYVLTAYLTFWFYEYWINRAISERLLNIIRLRKPDTDPGAEPYSMALDVPADAGGNNRELRIHGASRFVAMRDSRMKRGCFAFETYRREQLFEVIAVQTLPSEKALSQIIDSEVRAKQRHDKWSTLDDVSVIKQRYLFFFLLVNLILIAALAIPGYYRYALLPQKAELTATAESAEDGFNLADKLRISTDSAGVPQQSALLLAASGGGTRAALYTESVLHGLAQLGRLDDLVLVSGVSGGGAALAYFAAHRDRLVAGSDKALLDAQWKRFSCTMAAPFIQDVLEGVVEWRVVAGVRKDEVQQGLRLGELLAESFEQRFYQGTCDGIMPTNTSETSKTLGRVKSLGIILNTALTGHFPGLPASLERKRQCAKVDRRTQKVECSNCGLNHPIEEPVLCEWLPKQDGEKTLALLESDKMALQTSLSAGGRLILTNLADTDGFPDQGMPDAPSEYLTYVVLNNQEIKLTTAAALNANFPPVFSNAAVDVANNRRYWVTDGGAADNRGIISLLYALKHAVTRNNGIPREELREVDIIIAEASATSLDYSQDRGIGGKFGAAQKFASQLMLELMEDLEAIYKTKIRFHYLSMPMVLRSGGGVGTHWMLPANVTFKRPLAQSNMEEEYDGYQPKLSSAQVRDLIDALHVVPLQPTETMGSREEQLVWQWIREDWFTAHQAVWEKLVKVLGKTP
jgi:hypothetical protein